MEDNKQTESKSIIEDLFGLAGALAGLGLMLFVIASVAMFVFKVFSWIWS